MYFIIIDTRNFDGTFRFVMNDELPGKVLFFDTYKDASELMSWYFLNVFPYKIVDVDRTCSQ